MGCLISKKDHAHLFPRLRSRIYTKAKKVGIDVKKTCTCVKIQRSPSSISLDLSKSCTKYPLIALLKIVSTNGCSHIDGESSDNNGTIAQLQYPLK